jgi:putative addiction module antidote
MAYKTKVRKIGNSLGIVLPKEALQAMKVEEGATLYITEAPECSVQITPEDKDFHEMMEIAEKGMKNYRNALRELAK